LICTISKLKNTPLYNSTVVTLKASVVKRRVVGGREEGIRKPRGALDCAGHTIPHREGFGIRTAGA